MYVGVLAFQTGTSKVMQITDTHTAFRTCDQLRRYGWKFTIHSPQRPDPATSDLHPFGCRKKQLACKTFATDADVKQAVTSRLQIIDIDFFKAGLQALVSWWQKIRECLMNVWKSDRPTYYPTPMCHVHTAARIRLRRQSGCHHAF